MIFILKIVFNLSLKNYFSWKHYICIKTNIHKTTLEYFYENIIFYELIKKLKCIKKWKLRSIFYEMYFLWIHKKKVKFLKTSFIKNIKHKQNLHKTNYFFMKMFLNMLLILKSFSRKFVRKYIGQYYFSSGANSET